jgi:hypothetical protein
MKKEKGRGRGDGEFTYVASIVHRFAGKKKERKKWQQGNECSNQRSAKKKGT